MSWQQYVDNLMATGHMTSVGIFGLDGSPWAVSTTQQLKQEHIKTVIAAVSDSSKVSSGLQLAPEERYIFLRNDPGVFLILKKQQHGIIAYKSNQAVLIGVHDEKYKSEAILNDLGKVVDYLVKHGY